MEREFGPIRRRQYTSPTVNGKAIQNVHFVPRRERVIVDGYNLIFAWAELKALAGKSLDLARSKLVEMLINYQSCTKAEVVLVFDAYKVPAGVGEKYTEAELHVVYTKENETADMYIERLVDEIGRNDAVRVVTSDSLVRLGALRSGVLRTSSAEFQKEVDLVLERIAKTIRQNKQLVWKAADSTGVSTTLSTAPSGEASSPARGS